MAHMRADAQFLLCNRVGEETMTPVAGSIAGFAKCADCKHDLVLSPASVRALEASPDITVLCVACGLARLPDEGMEVTIAPGQVEELAAAGLDVAFPEGTRIRLAKPPR